jgi:hypothetical protein
LEGVVSSEEPCDWAIPHVDLVHHAPYALDPNPGGGPPLGVPAPLFNLVYHDALFVPWAMSKGGWGIPKEDWAFLHGLLNGGMPYLEPGGDDKHLERVRIMAALHRRVGLLEMTGHEFLDVGRRRQRSRFADGTVVEVDLAKETFVVTPELSEAEMGKAMKR